MVSLAGQIICADFSQNIRPSDCLPLYSISKGLGALATALAASEQICSLGEKVASTLSEWQDKEGKNLIRVIDLLQHTSGLDPGQEIIYKDETKDKLTAALTLNLDSNPQSRFCYGPSNYEVLSLFIQRKIGPGDDAISYLIERLLRPIGISAFRWRTDWLGQPMLSSGMFLSAPSLLLLGEHICEQIRAESKQVPEVFLPYTSLLAETSANMSYGLGCWINRVPSSRSSFPSSLEKLLAEQISSSFWNTHCLSSHAPQELLAFIGSYGQRLYISPSLDIVIVRLGWSPHFVDDEFLRLCSWP